MSKYIDRDKVEEWIVHPLMGEDRVVLCGFKKCVYNQNGVCMKEVIHLDERVEDIFVGCPDAEWKDGVENE